MTPAAKRAHGGVAVAAGFVVAVLLAACASGPRPPQLVLGEFEDDYGIRYSISDSLWHQRPNARYEVAAWHPESRTLVARNGDGNPSERGLWTRIDWIELEDMEPYAWAFCLTKYDAETREAATAAPAADGSNPRTGCGGFPFSRMKRVER